MLLELLWLAIDCNDPPKRHKRIRDTRLVPVVLDLTTSEDIELRIQRAPLAERLTKKAVRLCLEAYEQGGLLSNCDVAEILAIDDSFVSQLLTEHEKTHDALIPRRATLHDVGTGLAHKSIICKKRYRDGKESHVIARETYHSMDAVDRYIASMTASDTVSTNPSARPGVEAWWGAARPPLPTTYPSITDRFDSKRPYTHFKTCASGYISPLRSQTDTRTGRLTPAVRRCNLPAACKRTAPIVEILDLDRADNCEVHSMLADAVRRGSLRTDGPYRFERRDVIPSNLSELRTTRRF